MDPSKGGAWHYGFPRCSRPAGSESISRHRSGHGRIARDAISDATIAEYARHYATPDGMTAGFNYYRALRTDIPYVETLRSKKIAVPVLTIAGR